MIKQETIEINGMTFYHTFSDVGRLIEREGSLYSDAYDIAEYTYTESNESDPDMVEERKTEELGTVTENLSDEQALSVPLLFADWTADKTYAIGDRVLYDGVLYKCLIAHSSQADWMPDEATSLWARVLIPDPEVIPEWVQPDSTNAYMTGDKVTHNGHTWQSLVDNNVWEPSEAVPTLWEMIE